MVFINILKSKVTLDLYLDFKLSAEATKGREFVTEGTLNVRVESEYVGVSPAN